LRYFLLAQIASAATNQYTIVVFHVLSFLGNCCSQGCSVFKTGRPALANQAAL
jgi:hypothetical protein